MHIQNIVQKISVKLMAVAPNQIKFQDTCKHDLDHLARLRALTTRLSGSLVASGSEDRAYRK